MNTSDRPVRTRFAPSPTGMLHIGNARSALLNCLFARHHQGRFLLRFEDTDETRSRAEFVQAIEADLRWLGLHWDEEAKFQKERAERHRQALRTLAEKGLAYPCFCTESELALQRKLANSRGLPPRYSGRCRQLSATERETRMQNEAHTWRLAVREAEGSIEVRDLLRRRVCFHRRDLDDPVVVRSDGNFTFLLPNALDDALDGITHVLRGDDHLSNSAYQVWLLEALGHEAPVYAHHGLLLNADGGKLSKRSGGHEICNLRQQGLLPEALVQTLARLGHPNLPEDAASIEALAPHFHAESLSCAPVRWRDEELWRAHARLLQNLPLTHFAECLHTAWPIEDERRRLAFARLIQANLTRIEQAREFARLLRPDAPIPAKLQGILDEAGAAFFREAEALWREHAGDWRAWTQALRRNSQRKGRDLYLPLRVALTGRQHGPEMHAVIEFLGVEGVLARLRETSASLDDKENS